MPVFGTDVLVPEPIDPSELIPPNEEPCCTGANSPPGIPSEPVDLDRLPPKLSPLKPATGFATAAAPPGAEHEEGAEHGSK